MPVENRRLTPHFNAVGLRKWEKLLEHGYRAHHMRQGGVVFGTRHEGNVGHLSWHGLITWGPSHER
jgi:hypothetical protein